MNIIHTQHSFFLGEEGKRSSQRVNVIHTQHSFFLGEEGKKEKQSESERHTHTENHRSFHEGGAFLYILPFRYLVMFLCLKPVAVRRSRSLGG